MKTMFKRSRTGKKNKKKTRHQKYTRRTSTRKGNESQQALRHVSRLHWSTLVAWLVRINATNLPHSQLSERHPLSHRTRVTLVPRMRKCFPGNDRYQGNTMPTMIRYCILHAKYRCHLASGIWQIWHHLTKKKRQSAIRRPFIANRTVPGVLIS